MPASDHTVTVITRTGCHLCEAAATELARLHAELGFGYREVDLDVLAASAAHLRDDYADRIPVILIDGREHGYWRLEEKRFRAALAR